MSSQFEKIQAYLMKADPHGHSVYDQLVDVVAELVANKDKQKEHPLDLLERCSLQLKSERFRPVLLKEMPHSSAALVPSEFRRNLLLTLQKTGDFLSRVRTEQVDDKAVPDLLGDFHLFRSAGINLGQDTIYKLCISLADLVRQRGLTSARFFGKIFGTIQDYYICEAKCQPRSEDDIPSQSQASENNVDNSESAGTGANEFEFYVCTQLGGQWTRLPDVLPEQIVASRFVRRYFAGLLDSPVVGFPRFPWNEAVYLRAQIARIAASAVVSPKGFYVMNEEEETKKMVEDPEFKGAPVSELMTPAGWVHHRTFLLKKGRCTPWQPPEKEDGDETSENKNPAIINDAPAEPEEPEEPKELLQTLEEDKVPDLPDVWSFRTDPAIANAVHTAIVIQSQVWPGAFCICKKRTFANVYVGFGHRYLPHNFSPQTTPPIRTEYVPIRSDEDSSDPLKEQVDPLPPPPQEKEPTNEENGDSQQDGNENNEDE